MSFFGKLKQRLMKSSSRLEDGLESIVEDGGEVEEVVEATPETQPEPQSAPADEPEVQGAEEVFRGWLRNLRCQSLRRRNNPPLNPRQHPSPNLNSKPANPASSGRLMGRSETKQVTRRVLDDDMLEQLEELLIASDMGVETATRVTANIAEGRFGKKLSTDEIKSLLAQEVARIMEPVAKPLPIYAKTPQVVLVVGVNGSGKTTTIGKLASQFRAAGKSVVIAAGDTFRAAAVEQLQVWGERAGVPVY